MQSRDTRWPSAWQIRLEHRQRGYFTIEVLNVSKTGLRFSGGPGMAVRDQVRIRVCGRIVTARIERMTETGAVMCFDAPLGETELQTLRQFRRIA